MATSVAGRPLIQEGEDDHFVWKGLLNDDGKVHNYRNPEAGVGTMSFKVAQFATTPTVEYEGQFKDGVPHGDGTLRYEYKVTTEDGKEVLGGYRYAGRWDNGRRHGEGTLSVYPLGTPENPRRGDVYKGTWRNDRPNGSGELKLGVKRPMGADVKKGTWAGGFLPDADPDAAAAAAGGGDERQLPRGTLLFFDGDRYEGEVARSLPVGSGVYYYAHGGRYEMRCSQPRRQGEGWCWSTGTGTEGSRRNQRSMMVVRTAKYAGSHIPHLRGVLLPLDCIACPADDPSAGGFDVVTWCRRAGIVGTKRDAVAKSEFPLHAILDALLREYEMSDQTSREKIDLLRMTLEMPKLHATVTRSDEIRSMTLGEELPLEHERD